MQLQASSHHGVSVGAAGCRGAWTSILVGSRTLRARAIHPHRREEGWENATGDAATDSVTCEDESTDSLADEDGEATDSATGDEGATDSVTSEDASTDSLADEDVATDSATGDEVELDIT